MVAHPHRVNATCHPTGWADHADSSQRIQQGWNCGCAAAVSRLRLPVFLDNVLPHCSVHRAQAQAGEV